MPDAANPAPLALTPEIVTFTFPVFVMVTFCDDVVPSLTLPNDTLFVLALSVFVATLPVPDRLMVSGELGALLVKAIEPEKLPVVVGVNSALKLADLPGWITSGVEMFALNPDAPPVTLIHEIVSAAFPGFEI